jgi:hypothetical protein
MEGRSLSEGSTQTNGCSVVTGILTQHRQILSLQHSISSTMLCIEELLNQRIRAMYQHHPCEDPAVNQNTYRLEGRTCLLTRL